MNPELKKKPTQSKPSCDEQSSGEWLNVAPCFPWRSMDDAPIDGTVIVGKYGNDVGWIRWAKNRRCMLAGIGGGNGYFGEGWEDVENRLIVDDPEVWMTEENYHDNIEALNTPPKPKL